MNQPGSTVIHDLSTEQSSEQEERLHDAPLRDVGIAMLSQQCWCWGKDITRPRGNWLVQKGFARKEPPQQWKDCSSIYTLALSADCSVVLRGFGVFYGRKELGGVYLPRYEFSPRYTRDSTLRCPPWTDSMLDHLRPPTEAERAPCMILILELLDWIRQYEVDVAEELGLAYRRDTLHQWDNGKRLVTPAESIASSWRRLSQRLAADPSSLG